ncbi:MAG: hypothetical protein NWE89_09140 [Candidatus Bathyarchaeota archaeon]|nr:hypothetical protein [Candidatus Bathyarchaeota archaeon]
MYIDESIVPVVIFIKGGEIAVLWMILDQYLLSILSLGVEAVRRGVKFRSIDPLNKKPRRKQDTERPAYINGEDEKYLFKYPLIVELG